MVVTHWIFTQRFLWPCLLILTGSGRDAIPHAPSQIPRWTQPSVLFPLFFGMRARACFAPLSSRTLLLTLLPRRLCFEVLPHGGFMLCYFPLLYCWERLLLKFPITLLLTAKFPYRTLTAFKIDLDLSSPTPMCKDGSFMFMGLPNNSSAGWIRSCSIFP